MKFNPLITLIAGSLTFGACQRETVQTNSRQANSPDTTKTFVNPDSPAALDTATLQNLYVAYINIKSPENPNDSAYFYFVYSANYFDTLMNEVSLSNFESVKGLPANFDFTFIDTSPYHYVTSYKDLAYQSPYNKFTVDYYMSNGLPYYIYTYDEWWPKTISDSSLKMYYVYDASGRIKEIFNYKTRTVEDRDETPHSYDERKFVFDKDENIVSEEVIDSGDVEHIKTYKYEYSNRASRICVRKNALPFSRCRIFDHSIYLLESFFKREVVRITEIQIDLTGGTPVTTATIVHNYSYEYNSRGWVSKISDKVTGGTNVNSLDYSFLYFSDPYFHKVSTY